MTRASLSIFAAGLALAASPALAQEPAAPGKKVPAEIERGLYTEFDFGTLAILGSDVQPGVMAGFGVGTDLSRYLKLELRMLNATADSTGTVYRETGAVSIPQEITERNPCPDNPNQACTAAPDVQASLVTAGVKGVYPLSDRLEVQGLVAGGVFLGNPAPKQIFDFDPDVQLVDPGSVETGSAPIVGFGGGVEYYTRLRHFSVGANVAIWIAPGVGGTMATLFPTIKYTF